MAEPMLINATTASDGTTVLALHGDVNITTADHMREQLLLAFARHPEFVLDLSQAMFLDISALRALSAVFRQAVRQGQPAPALRGVRPQLAKLLKVTGLDQAFTIEPGPSLAWSRPAASIGSGRAEPGFSDLWVARNATRESHRELASTAS